jgi:hypothetical protein
MRLIDVDALPKAVEYDYGTGEMKILYYDAWVIAHAPTVDAIPVEFIEKRMKELGDYEESWNLRGLIEDWRKENEVD